MKIQKTELVHKLNKIKGVVPKKPTKPALQGILVKDGYLIANNMEMTVKTKLEGIEDECFIIPERAFDLINNLPDGEVDISVTAENVITIKAGKVENKYQTIDPEQFPLMTEQEEGSEWEIKADMLLESIKRVFYAISGKGSSAVIASMCLQADDGWLNFVGLDGHVLAWDKIAYDGKFKLLIPRNTVEKLKSFGLSGNVRIMYSRTTAIFAADDIEVYTRLVEGKYFKYQTMFKELPMHTIVSRTELLEAMTRAKMCTEESRPVRFEIQENHLNLSIKDRNTDYHETIDLQEKLMEPLVIGFNAKLVLETLKAFDCENVKISFEGPKMPMIVEAEDSDFRTIVLPVAIS